MVGDREMNMKFEEYRKAYTESYNAALVTKGGGGSVITLYGYTLTQILELIEKEEMNKIKQPIEEKLMTREEAVKKIKDRVSDTEFANLDYLLIAKLEALSLIKLKEENKRFELYNPARDEIVETDNKNDVYNWLLDGFKIVKDNG